MYHLTLKFVLAQNVLCKQDIQQAFRLDTANEVVIYLYCLNLFSDSFGSPFCIIVLS